ncbi:hypothetical protein IW148_003849 [Coemansia sp. RSA 1199]|nr:hypothetical protein IW148_003849 [Coemansia sp. RSA 1199]
MSNSFFYFFCSVIAFAGLLLVNADPLTTVQASKQPLANKQGDWRNDMLVQVNKIRTNAGLPSMKIDTRLNAIAQAHSDYQAQINILTHNDTSGSLGQRVTDAGIQWLGAAENVASGPTQVDVVVGLWNASAGHYANIVGNYDISGFGLANNNTQSNLAKLTPFWTLVFVNER